jgi:hypothetical protein
MRLLGLLILQRITDSPVYPVECRHHYYSELIGEKRLAMTLLDLVRKAREKVNKDQEVEMMENKRNSCSWITRRPVLTVDW